MKTSDKKWIRIRIYLVAIFFIIGLGINLCRAYVLQVVDRKKLNTYAQSSYQASVKLPPKRGTIYDRNGQELAVSLEVSSVYANPRLIEDKKMTAGHLALCLDEPVSSMQALLNKESPFVWIKRRVSPEKVSQLKTLNLKGIGFTSESRRYYPGKDIAGQLLGFVGNDNQGLEGIEKYYEKVLKGPNETLVQMRDAVGRPFYISEPVTEEGQDMRNITLTIDKAIQYKAQEALQEQIKATNAKGGQCLIMKPDTGEILAMAVYPSFNPNIFNQFTSADWRNRLVTDVYEPGSAIKAFLLSIALEKRAVTPDTQINCENGEYRYEGHTIHDTHRHGTLSVEDVITVSSNIGAIKIGQRVGYDTFYSYMKNFGFGEKAGIDLAGERDGFIRSPQASKDIDKANTYFGQSMTVTSLQLATAMCAIANGGKLMKPYLVKEMTDQTGNVVMKNQPVMVRQVLSEDTARRTTQVLEDVVSEKGTAAKAAILGYTVAGKTGTPQKIDPAGGYSHAKHLSVFVGFVPAYKPEMVMLVMVDEPEGTGYGGLVAAPVFSQVGKWALNTMRVNPDAPIDSKKTVMEAKAKNPEPPSKANVVKKAIAEEAEPESTETDQANLVPDFSGQTIRQVIQKGKQLGLDVIVDGTGTAIAQYPQAGSPLSGITFIKVTFKPSA
jgi:cell division protein FtsI (penicillin-binding protein 3)